MISNRSSRRAHGQRGRAGSYADRDDYDRDYGFGRTEEGRPITGQEGADGVHDPQAPIYEPKGETFNVDLSRQKSVPMCQPDQHDLVPDGEPGAEIPGTQSMTCRHCPYGRLVQL